MDKTTGGAAVVAGGGAIWQQEPCGAEGFFGLSSLQLIDPCPREVEVNKPSHFRAGAGNLKYDQIVGPGPWPIEVVQHTWERCMSQPMVQKVPATCVLVACTVCVEAVHRLQHEKLHGKGTATKVPRAAPPDDLLEACRNDHIWKPGEGADVRDVLKKIREMGGVLTTTDAPTRAQRLLPLRSWEEHRWDDFAATALSPGRVADLLYNNGPCIGVLWVSPSYRHCVADDGDDAMVYASGCGRMREEARRDELKRYPPGQVGWHAVVCFGFRRGGKDVLVLDNHTPTGPRRWIDSEEFYRLYTLSV